MLTAAIPGRGLDSCKRASEMLGRPLPDLNIIALHLGSGCSMACVKAGQCIDTTMGMTPLEGLMMATRSGDVDAGEPLT